MDLPEPLLMLSLQEYRHYAQDTGKRSQYSRIFRPRPISDVMFSQKYEKRSLSVAIEDP